MIEFYPLVNLGQYAIGSISFLNFAQTALVNLLRVSGQREEQDVAGNSSIRKAIPLNSADSLILLARAKLGFECYFFPDSK